MPPRRCSGLSTTNRPPNASRARPPSSCGSQRSSSRTSRPRSSSSSAVTRPAMPAPTTTTSWVGELPLPAGTRASYGRAPRGGPDRPPRRSDAGRGPAGGALAGRRDGVVGPEQLAGVVRRLDLAEAAVDGGREEAPGLDRLLHEVHVRLASVVGGQG